VLETICVLKATYTKLSSIAERTSEWHNERR